MSTGIGGYTDGYTAGPVPALTGPAVGARIDTSSLDIDGTGWTLGYGAYIGGEHFRLAVSPERPLEIVTAPLEAPRINTGETAEDFTAEFGTRFSRSDFAGGEGLTFAHRARREDDDGTRYRDSYNVDVDSDGNVTLLREVEQVDAVAETGLRAAYVDGTVWVTNGASELRKSTNPTAATPTFALDATAPVAVDVVGIGTTVYAADSSGVERLESGGSWTGTPTWHSLADIERLWAAKGRLFAAVGNVLYAMDTDATGTKTTVLTIAEGDTFCDLTDASSHILVTATDGYVYAIADDGTDLTVAGQSHLEGEVPCGIDAAYGVVIYGTGTDTDAGGVTGRLYTATLTAGGTLTEIDRVKTWDATTLDRTPRYVVSLGDSLYVGVTEALGEANMWRYDLERAALHRSYPISAGATTVDGISVGETLWVTVDGDGLHRVADTYAASGWISTPLGDLFTASDKTWADISTTFSDLTGDGERVKVSYTTVTDATTFVDLVTYTYGDDTSVAYMPRGVISRYFGVKVTLEANTDQTTTPMLRAVSVRAFPRWGELIVTIPVNISDQIERPGKMRVTNRLRGDKRVETLRSLEGAATTVEFPHLKESLRGVVESIERRHNTIPARGAVTEFAQITFRGTRIDPTGTTNGLNLMGTSFDGLGIMGSALLMGRVE